MPIKSENESKLLSVLLVKLVSPDNDNDNDDDDNDDADAVNKIFIVHSGCFRCSGLKTDERRYGS